MGLSRVLPKNDSRIDRNLSQTHQHICRIITMRNEMIPDQVVWQSPNNGSSLSLWDNLRLGGVHTRIVFLCATFTFIHRPKIELVRPFRFCSKLDVHFQGHLTHHPRFCFSRQTVFLLVTHTSQRIINGKMFSKPK